MQNAVMSLQDTTVREVHFKVGDHVFHFNELEKRVQIYSYKNTYSEAGLPQIYQILPSEVSTATVWTDGMGNPTYCFHMENGDTHLRVGEYGAMNGFNYVPLSTVRRKKDLF
jgi:hypothetical protein